MSPRARPRRPAPAKRKRTGSLPEHFAELFDAVPDGIVLVDAAGRIAHANRHAALLFGYPREQLEKLTVDALVPERLRPAHAGHRGKYAAAPRARPMGSGLELSGRRRDGTEFPVEISLSPLTLDDGGRVTIAAIRDVTERKRTAERSHSADRLQSLSAAVEQSPAVVFITNPDGVIEYVNRRFTEVTGYTPAEAIGRNPRLLQSGLTPLSTYRAMWGTILSGREWRAEIQNRRKNGELYWDQASIAPIRDGTGAITHFVAVQHDVTERKRAEVEIRELNQDLERRVEERTRELAIVNEELEGFTYSVSHDLRAPLRQVNGFAEILGQDLAAKLDPESRHHLERIQHGARHMTRLVDDLLKLARIGRQPLGRESTPLRPLVDSVIRDLPVESGRRVEWRIAELPTVECDPGLMQATLTNLLGNAVKYTRGRDPAVIEVGSLARNGRSGIYVKDNGVGFDMRYADKLFGVFQRLHRDEDFEGSGVGLATVQRIVHKHGGEIWAEATPGQGATFSFTVGAGA